MSFNDIYRESIQDKHLSNVGFTSTAKGVVNEANASINPHQLNAYQIPAIDIINKYGPLVGDGIAAGIVEEHIVKLTADPTVNNNKAWLAYESGCITPGHSSRGGTRLDQFIRVAETQYKLRIFCDVGNGSAPNHADEIFPSETRFNWDYNAGAGTIYFDEDPSAHGKILPLWGIFYTYTGPSVGTLLTAEVVVESHTHYDVDFVYVDDTTWVHVPTHSGFVTVPDDLAIFVNGVKNRSNDIDYYTSHVIDGSLYVTFSYGVNSDNWWVNGTYILDS